MNAPIDKRLLERCELEALHLSGAIQPHGALLVVAPDGQVSHVSANITAFFDQPPEAWLGKPLPESLLPFSAAVAAAPGSRHVFEAGIATGAGPLDIVATRGETGAVTLEFARAGDAPPGAGPELEALKALPDPLTDSAALEAARQALVDDIAALTGFERVMFYGFLGSDDGEVLAEARLGSVYGSYLGLRFPASDIPRIARDLYLKNPWRMIPDASAEPVPIISTNTESAPLDLTWSDLRSVSPIHRIYLANMGVAASLSFPVVCGGELVALVSAHHSQPYQLPTPLLERAAFRVRTHAFAYASYRSQQRMRMIDGMMYRFDVMHDMLRRHGDLASAWPELGEWLCREFDVDGATLCQEDQTIAVGVSFEMNALSTLDHWFNDEIVDFVWTGDSLRRQVPGYPLSEVAGAIAIRLGRSDGRSVRIYLGRTEHIHEVAWGGNPEKPLEHHDGEIGIAPRRSFEKWVERRLGYCQPWNNESRLLALKLRELLLAALHP